jgi:hypothetical protein
MFSLCHADKERMSEADEVGLQITYDRSNLGEVDASPQESD